jgi:hypothetical protein
MAPLDCRPQEVGIDNRLCAGQAVLAGTDRGGCRDEGLMWRLHGRPINAYRELAQMLRPRTRSIMIYAMCVFINFGSLSILIGALGDGPERKHDVVKLGLRSNVSDTLTVCMSGASLEHSTNS